MGFLDVLTLGIETSCDETSCAVIEGLDKVRSNVVSSSLFRHRPFGGVVPEIASRHCLEQIDFVFVQALRQAKVPARRIRLVAVTHGPGLVGSLLVGICFAKMLSYQLRVPLVGVNHLEAHVGVNFLGMKEPEEYIGLIVSGGHTSLCHFRKRKVFVMGQTVDDACGEAFDKVAKLLGLGYPGGPVIERYAAEGDPAAFRFTKPKQDNRFDFSFSGIKTAVLHYVRDHCVNRKFQCDMAASFQRAAVDWLVQKAVDAAREKKIKTIVVGGGVSANTCLRETLRLEAGRNGISVFFPPLVLTGDNGVMIARRGLELYRLGHCDSLRLTGDPNLKIGA